MSHFVPACHTFLNRREPRDQALCGLENRPCRQMSRFVPHFGCVQCTGARVAVLGVGRWVVLSCDVTRHPMSHIVPVCRTFLNRREPRDQALCGLENRPCRQMSRFVPLYHTFGEGLELRRQGQGRSLIALVWAVHWVARNSHPAHRPTPHLVRFLHLFRTRGLERGVRRQGM